MHIQAIGWRALLGLVLLLFVAGAAWALAGREPGEIPAARRLAVATRVLALEPGYTREQRFVGRTEFAQASALSFELPGRIATLRVDEGDRVEQGDVLAELDTERLRARRAELVAARDEAKAQLRLARLRDGRSKSLLDEDVISPQDADDTRLEAAAREAVVSRVEAQIRSVDVDLEKSVLLAPFPGEVSARFLDPGVVVRAGDPVMRLLQTDRPELRIGVARGVAAQIEEGAWLDVVVADRAHRARVLAVLPERNDATRTVPVRLSLEPGEGMLHEGDLASLRFREDVASEGYWLPRAALTEGARGLWAVYVAVPEPGAGAAEQRLERRPVELLHEAGDRVYLRGALAPGERVVEGGVHRLVPGQIVALVSDAPVETVR